MHRNPIKELLACLLVFSFLLSRAQLSGTVSVPGTYTSLAQAITDINTQGVNGPLTVNVLAGYTETVPVGGLALTASGTIVNTITFQKSGLGANPLLTAYSGGAATPVSAVQDGIWRFIGSDFIRVDGIDLSDPNTSNPSTMEYGFGFFKANTSNGCQSNTITNCAISLKSVNNAAGAGPSAEGSRAINVVNALATNQNANLSPISAAGSNSFNKFYSNSINGCNIGVALIGYAAPSPFTLADTDNEVGGLLAASGNTIVNFGGAAAATLPAAGIRTLAQYNVLVSRNYLINNNGSGANHVFLLRGIFLNTAVSAVSTVLNNTITLTSGASTQNAAAIENLSGATAAGNTLTIQNNVITACSFTNGTTGSFYGIFNNAASAAGLIISDNTFTNVVAFGTTGSSYMIYNTGAIAGPVTMTNNFISTTAGTISTSGSYYGIFNGAAVNGDLRMSANTFSNVSANYSTGSVNFLLNTGASTGSIQIQNNLISASTLTTSSTGSVGLVYNNAASTASLSISGNTLNLLNMNSGSGSSYVLYNRGAASNTFTSVQMLDNLFQSCNFNSSSSGAYYQLWNNGVTTTVTSIAGNTLSACTWSGTSGTRYMLSNFGQSTVCDMSRNLIGNCTATANTTGQMQVIYHNNTGAVSGGTLSLNNNTISGCSFAATTGDTYYIHNLGATTNTFASISFTANTISSGTQSVTGTGAFYAIYNEVGSALDFKMNSNAFLNMNNGAATGSSIIFYNRTPAGTYLPSAAINNNSIRSLVYNSAGNGAFYGFFNNGTAGNNYTTVTMSSNTFSANTLNATTGALNIIFNGAPIGQDITISNNLITQVNNTLSTSGAFVGIQNAALISGNLSIVGNSLTALTSSASTSNRYLIYSSATVNGSVHINQNLFSQNTHSTSSNGAYANIFNVGTNGAFLGINNNTISASSTSLQTGTTYLILNSSAATNTIVSMKIENNALNTYSSLSTTGAFYGIYNNVVSGSDLSIANNTLSNIYIPTPANTRCMICTNSTISNSVSVNSNSIGNITATLNTTGSVFGVQNTGPVTGTYAASNNSLTGFNVNATSGSLLMFYNTGTVQNIYFNSNKVDQINFAASTTGIFSAVQNSASSSAIVNISSNSLLNSTVTLVNGATQLFYTRGPASATVTNLNVSGNLISGFNHVATTGSLSCFYNAVSVNSVSIQNNTINAVAVSSTASPRAFICNAGVASAQINLNSNVISSYSGTLGVSALHLGVWNTGVSLGDIHIDNNSISSYSITAPISSITCILNSAAANSVITLSGNSLSQVNAGLSGSSVFNAIANTATNAIAIALNSNTVSASTVSTGSTAVNFISNTRTGTLTSSSVSLQGNLLANCAVITTSGNISIVNNAVETTSITTVDGNRVLNSDFSSTTGSVSFVQNSAPASGSLSLNSNLTNACSVSVASGTIFRPIINWAAAGQLSESSNSVTALSTSGNSLSTIVCANNASVSGNLSFNNNQVSGFTYSIISSASFLGIQNTGSVTGNLQINANTFSNNSTATFAGNVNLLYNIGAVSGDVQFNGNSLSQTFANSASGFAGDLSCIVNVNAVSGSSLSVLSNTFSNINYGPAGATGNIHFIQNQSIVSSFAASGNIWNGLVLNHSGDEELIFNYSAANTVAVTNNSIVGGYSITAPAGSMYLYIPGTSVPQNASQTISGNNFSGINASNAGSGSFYGIYSLDQASQKTISDNLISNINYNASGFMYMLSADKLGDITSLAASVVSNNTLSTVNWQGPLYGINIGPTMSSTIAAEVFNNSVVSLTTAAGTQSAFGVYLSASGEGINFKRNKIGNIRENGTLSSVCGLYVTGSATVNVLNNTIGDISAPFATQGDAANGVFVNGTGNVNMFYNTIVMNSAANGSNASVNALLCSSNPSVDLRNNIFINTAAVSGSGVASAYKRSVGSLVTYLNSSDQNIFFAGVPSATRIIFSNGTSTYSTLVAFQTAVSPRENSSTTENTTFLSTLAQNANFLHIDPSVFSLAESGAANIAGITDDFDQQTRQGNPGYAGSGTAPDIGADEYNQVLAPCSSASAGIASIAGSTMVCEPGTAFLFSNGYSNNGSIQYQWRIANAAGGPYTNVTTGSGFDRPSFSTASLSAGNYYFVFVTTCTIGQIVSTSNELTLTVMPAPGATAVVSPSVLCSGMSFSLNGQSSSGATYTWSGPSNFVSNNQNTSFSVAGLPEYGTYTLNTLKQGCSSTATVNVVINPSPPVFSITPASPSICAGASQTLVASVPLTTPTLNMGLQTNQNGASGYPAPYSAYYGGQKMQFLVLASELNAAGFTYGTPLTSISFPVVALGSGWGTAIQDCQNFQLSLKQTTLNTLQFFENNLTVLVTQNNFTPAVGYGNTHAFQYPFVWDGTSNLIVETAFSNSIIGSSATSVIQNNSATGFQSTVVYRADNQSFTTVSSATAGNVNVSFIRPDFRLSGLQVGTYSWSPSQFLSTGSGSVTVSTPNTNVIYTLTLSNGQCASENSVSISVFTIPQLNISSTSNSVCLGNTATLTVSGAPSYTWSNGANSSFIIVAPAGPSTYFVNGGNGICANGSASVSVGVLPAVLLNVTSSHTAVCVGQTASLTAFGASTYSWSTGQSGSVAVVSPSVNTTFSVTGTSGPGCFASKSISIKSNPLPVLTLSTSSSTICIGDQVSINAAGASSFTWSPGNMTGSMILVTPSVSTTYQAIGKDLNNCSSTATIQLNPSDCTTLSENIEIRAIKIFPNPSTGIVNFQFNVDIDQVEILSCDGKLLDKKALSSNGGAIDLQLLPKGLYFLRFSGSGTIIYQKITLQ